ncbi:MAG TPA: glycosyltransferase family 9 protein [Isosphaeraceae bacterium]|nr:glycosyltransferase family 9 protein [Isosphaeraceae bacterium]
MRLAQLAARAGRFLWWRTYMSWIYPLGDPLSARWGWAARLVRWPLPWLAPYRRSQLHLLRPAALGDVLMCTPALRELKRRNPSCQVTVYTKFPDAIAGLPFIDRVGRVDESPGDAIWPNYERSLPPRRHIARIFGDHLGLAVHDIRPSCVVDPALRDRFRAAWQDRPRPWIVVSRRAGGWTPNKDWPDELWDELIDRMASRGTVIEVGVEAAGLPPRSGGSYVDLRGQTTVPELIAAIAASDVLVGPITGTVHIAAAMGVPAVVIYGGYEHPNCSSYPGNINLYSPVDCAPCWLRDPCPFGKKCLHQITPDQVEAAVHRLWAANRSGSSAGTPGVRPQSSSWEPFPTASSAHTQGLLTMPSKGSERAHHH